MIAQMIVPTKPNIFVMPRPSQGRSYSSEHHFSLINPHSSLINHFVSLVNIDITLSDLSALQIQNEILRQENAKLRILLEQDTQADVWVGTPEPVLTHHVISSPVEFAPYFSMPEFED
jgi:hypothetical protein